MKGNRYLRAGAVLAALLVAMNTESEDDKTCNGRNRKQHKGEENKPNFHDE